MKPLVSILIPMYNSQIWITETIQSVLNQTWEKLEIILVDDGSTDNSYSIAKALESPIIKVIRQENRGCSAARNRAHQEAQGELIQYLDADDLIALDKIERQIKLLQTQGSYDFVISGEWARFFNSPDEAKFISEPVWNDMLPIDWLVCSWEGGGMMHPAAWLIPRTLSEKAGKFDETPCPDAEGEYITRVLLNSKGVLFCKEARSYYRSGISKSLSTAKSPQMLTALYQSLVLSTNHLLSVEDSYRTRKACATVFQRFVYSTYPELPDLVEQAEFKVQSLGGSHLKPGGGYIFQFLNATLGWKVAKQLKKFKYRLSAS